jgi:hypothetical protein
MKVKIFCGTHHQALEADINQWLSGDGEDVTIEETHVQLSGSTIMILFYYSE